MSSATRAAIVAASMSSQTIGFIGCGNMATAMIKGILADEASAGFQIFARDVDPEKITAIQNKSEGKVRYWSDDINPSIVVLAIKPQSFNADDDLKLFITANLGPRYKPLVLSVMAGVRIGTIKAKLGYDRIARAMPNLGAQVGEALSVWYTRSDDVADYTVEGLLNPLGDVIRASDEDQLDKLSAISGCGPGYVFLFMEALQDAAVALGVPLDVARRVAVQTVLGSAVFARDNASQHLAQLKSMVTSPGGTTAAGLSELERGGLRTAVQDAVEAAYDQGTFLSDSVTK